MGYIKVLFIFGYWDILDIGRYLDIAERIGREWKRIEREWERTEEEWQRIERELKDNWREWERTER